MLILVAVTISMAVNGGLFGYAGNAAKDTELEKNKELARISLQEGMSTDDLIEKYTTGEIEEVHNWTRGTGANIDKFTCSHCNLEVQMGQIVEYTPDTVADPSTVSGLDSGVAQGITKGDLDAADFGTGGSQQFSQEDLTWVVLGIEDQNNNGTNETLLITTTTPTNETLTLYGAAAYNNGIGITNKICRDLYSSTTYGKARNMKTEDIDKALNWYDTRGMYVDKNGTYHKVNAGTKFSDLPTEIQNAVLTKGENTPDGTPLSNYNIDGYYYQDRGYRLVDGTNVDSTSNPITGLEYRMIFSDGTNYLSYWLSSRGCIIHAQSGWAAFGIGTVWGGSVKNNHQMFFSHSGTDNYYGYGVRPIVSLTSSFPTITNVNYISGPIGGSGGSSPK